MDRWDGCESWEGTVFLNLGFVPILVILLRDKIVIIKLRIFGVSKDQNGLHLEAPRKIMVNCGGSTTTLFATWSWRTPPKRTVCLASPINAEQLRAKLDQLHSEAHHTTAKGSLRSTVSFSKLSSFVHLDSLHI